MAVVDGAVNAAAAPATVTALSAAVARSEAAAERVAEVASTQAEFICSQTVAEHVAASARVA